MAQPDGRRLRIHHGEFFDRGFSRSFFLVEELTEELRASEKGAYEKLIRLMSHEVNNSVGAVRSLLESSLNYAGQLRPEDGADFQNALTVAIARMQNLNAFVNGFADVVRLPAPRFEPCRIDELVGDILTLLRPELESRRIVTTLSVAEDVEPVSCDKNQMEQVLLNVMRNSIETIGTSGSIGIEVTRNDLRIADSGAGIAPEVAPLLFSPFFSTKRDGRGLGLTLTQEILKQHRFDFALQNRPEGGAEFRLSFRAEAPRGS
jgi:signal transduction histidine kinase